MYVVVLQLQCTSWNESPFQNLSSSRISGLKRQSFKTYCKLLLTMWVIAQLASFNQKNRSSISSWIIGFCSLENFVLKGFMSTYATLENEIVCYKKIWKRERGLLDGSVPKWLPPSSGRPPYQILLTRCLPSYRVRSFSSWATIVSRKGFCSDRGWKGRVWTL